MKKIFILFLFSYIFVFSQDLEFFVSSDKILYSENEPLRGKIKVKNKTDSIFNGYVKVYLENEIDNRSEEILKQIKVPPKEDFEIDIEFEKNQGKYGYAMVGELYNEKQEIILKKMDFFNVCDNYWNVSLVAHLGCIWQQWEKIDDNVMIPKKDFKWAENLINNWRKEYYNGFEKFFWAPDDFIELTPDEEMWFSGQTRYMETKNGLIELIKLAHKQGMKAITYAKRTGGGAVGIETARRNPEWIWHNKGTLNVGRGVREIKNFNIPTKKFWSEYIPVNYNMNDKNVVEIGIKELIESAKIFGWDGARWDGNFNVRSEIYDFEGNLIEKLSQDEVDERNKENMRITKEKILKVFPNYVFGYNWANEGSCLKINRELIELCKGGGLIMNEYINQADEVQHPLHKWIDFALLLVKDTQIVKNLGGYYGPILGRLKGTVDETYKNIFAYAAGANPYFYHEFGDFVTRYSAFIWDNNLRKIYEPETILLIPDNVWWKHWVYEREINSTTKQLIIHLINPPEKPYVGDLKKNFPEVIKNIEIKVYPIVNFKDYKVFRVVKLDPKQVSREIINFEEILDCYKFKIDQLSLWNIVIVEFKKTKGGR